MTNVVARHQAASGTASAMVFDSWRTLDAAWVDWTQSAEFPAFSADGKVDGKDAASSYLSQ
jgi:hypothetical protein